MPKPKTLKPKTLKPMAFWKQAILALLLLGLAAYGWSERAALAALLDVGTEQTAGPGDRRGGGGGPGGGDRRRNSVAPVIVAGVEMRADDVTLELVGTARALRSVDLRASAGGQVVFSALEAGRRVEAGERLLQVEGAAEALEVDLATAQLEAAERRLARLLELERSGAAAAASIDEARTEAALAEIALAQAERALAELTVTAPFAGVLGVPQVELGDWIDPGQPLSSLDDRSRLLIEAMAPETFAARAEIGASAALRAASAPGRALIGEISEIDSRFDAATRSTLMRVALDNADDALRPGASFVIELAFEGPDAPAAPELALRYGREGLYVWRIRDDVAERAPVRLVRRRAGIVLLESLDPGDPLIAGDLIVVEGAQRVRDGGDVRIIGAPLTLEGSGAESP